MSAHCNQCGDCCKVVVTAWPLRHYRDIARGYAAWVASWQSGGDELPEGWEEEDRAKAERAFADGSFIGKHWHRITQGQAAEALPGMGYPGHYFYTCDAWDADSGLCTAHSTRPPICRDFPWYGTPVGDRRLHPAFSRCAYWGDVKPEQRPATIRLIALQPRRTA